jgi:hypothetical protein
MKLKTKSQAENSPEEQWRQKFVELGKRSAQLRKERFLAGLAASKKRKE